MGLINPDQVLSEYPFDQVKPPENQQLALMHAETNEQPSKPLLAAFS